MHSSLVGGLPPPPLPDDNVQEPDGLTPIIPNPALTLTLIPLMFLRRKDVNQPRETIGAFRTTGGKSLSRGLAPLAVGAGAIIRS